MSECVFFRACLEKSCSEENLIDSISCDLENGNKDLLSSRGLYKSATQPITCTSAKRHSDTNECHSGSSIQMRVKALKINGEEGWKKRISKVDDESQVELRVRSNNSANRRCNSIAERVSMLEHSSKWKDRIGEKDAILFTVAGRMGQNTPEINTIKTPERVRRTPKPVPFRSQTTSNMPHLLQNQVSPALLLQQSTPPSTACQPSNEKTGNAGNSTAKTVLISIPKPDDDETFTSFFCSNSSKNTSDQNSFLTDDSFVPLPFQRSNL